MSCINTNERQEYRGSISRWKEACVRMLIMQCMSQRAVLVKTGFPLKASHKRLSEEAKHLEKYFSMPLYFSTCLFTARLLLSVLCVGNQLYCPRQRIVIETSAAIWLHFIISVFCLIFSYKFLLGIYPWKPIYIDSCISCFAVDCSIFLRRFHKKNLCEEKLYCGWCHYHSQAASC